MSAEKMKIHLFYTFLIIFVATSIVTLLGVTKIISIDDFFLKGLFSAFLIELAGAVAAIYRRVDFFNSDSGQSIADQSHTKNPSLEPKMTPISHPKVTVPSNPINEPKVPVPVKVATTYFKEYLSSIKSLTKYIQYETSKMPLIETDDSKIHSRVIGMNIVWDLVVFAVSQVGDQEFEVVACEKESPFMVWSGSINLKEAPDIRLFKKGDEITMSGQIQKVESYGSYRLQDSHVKHRS